MLLVLVLFTLVACVHAVGNVTQCPEGCNCEPTYPDRQLTVDCSHRLPDVDEEQLYHQLDSMLSADHCVEHLTSLSITNTPLTRVPASVCKLLNLNSLNFDRNRLTELPDNCFIKLTKLVTLRARNNAIVGLQDGLFEGLQSLVDLYLRDNQISFIGLRVFSNSSDLTSLRFIDLFANWLTSVEPWPFVRLILGNETSKVTITLGSNRITTFTNKLNFQFRCGMKLYGYLDLSTNPFSHIMDMFNGWNLGDPVLAIICLSNYKGVLTYHRQMEFNFYRWYTCDCIDFPFYTFVRLSPLNNMLDNVRCRSDQFGSPFKAISVPLKEFVCEQTDRCPSSCRCVYRPANITLHVYCSAANLSSLPLDLPPLPKSYVKYKLDFSNNKLLRRLEHRPYFANTTILDVSNCGFTDIGLEELKEVSLLSVVNLRENKLQSFPRQADSVNISARLLIGNNPWRCSCDDSWVVVWLQSLSHQIADPGDITCASTSGVYGRNLLYSTVNDFCPDPEKHVLTITLSAVSSVAAVILLLIITGIVVYKVRVKFYRRWKFHPFDRDECVGEDMDYDVFFCCSSEDHNPHGLRILREIESKGYRVCYHLRDFLAGALITENMIQSIKSSKRTVCLLSNNFLQR